MQIIGIYFIQSLEKYFVDNFNNTLKAQANLLSVNLEKYLIDNEKGEVDKRSEINELVDNLVALNSVDVSIIDSSGIILSTSEKDVPSIVGQKISQIEVNRALLGTRDEAIRVDIKSGHRMKFLAVPIKHGNTVLGAVFIKASIEGVYETVHKINRILVTATIIALLFTALLGFVLSRTITRPIKEITKQAAKLTMGDFNQQLKVYGDDEIGRLSETFNRMSKRLRDAIYQHEEEKEKLSTILTHMSDGVIATDEKGEIIVINQRAIDLIDLKKEEIIGQKPVDIFKGLTIPKGGRNILYEYHHKGEMKVLKMAFNTIQRFNKGEVRAIIVLYDVTKEQKLEQMRKDFVANVSHELRTPLTTIKSYLDALEDGAIGDKEISERFIGVANNETDRMIRLVTDLLQLSSLDERNVKLNKTNVSIEEMIEDVVDRFSFQCKQKAISMVMDISKGISPLRVDRDQLDQVLDNLISNAIKYTKENGKIKVSAEERNQKVYIQVTDTGMGIPKSHLNRLFERFYRVDKARSRELGGTGLGLSIAKEIIKAHRGEIYIASEIDKGTKVTFYIPIIEEMEAND